MNHPWLAGLTTTAPVLVLQFPGASLPDCVSLATELRRGGVGCELYPDGAKLGKQFQYAEKRGHTLAVFAGPEELAAGVVKVKNLAARTEVGVPRGELVATVTAELARVKS